MTDIAVRRPSRRQKTAELEHTTSRLAATEAQLQEALAITALRVLFRAGLNSAWKCMKLKIVKDYLENPQNCFLIVSCRIQETILA